MFIPNLFRFESETEKIAFMQQYSFATIVTTKDGIPIATQLPFVIITRVEQLILSGHFALANEQAKHIEEHTSLVIFSEPHAYISPRHYDKPESVPTWDYIAVHAYGKARILTADQDKILALEQMIMTYEPEYLPQWNSLSDKFKYGMIKGIVAFELDVADLQGQQKLSQNKSRTERERIIRQLEQSDQSTETDLAAYIRNIDKP